MEDQTLPNEGLTRLLLERLEHISADSVLAHKASGIRGALIRCVKSWNAAQGNHLGSLLEMGFSISEAMYTELFETSAELVEARRTGMSGNIIRRAGIV